MLEFLRVGVTIAARFAQTFTRGEMGMSGGAAPVLRVFNPVLDETVTVAVTAAGATVTGSAQQGRVALEVGGMAGSLPADLIAATGVEAGRPFSGFLAPTTALQGQAVEVMSLAAGGQDWLVAARSDGGGVEAFRIGAGGALSRSGAVPDTRDLPLAGVSALAGAVVGGTAFVFAASAREDGITVLSLSASGALARVGRAGVAEGLPIDTPTALRVVEAFGAQWLIVAAAGTSSLTVLRIGPGGALTAVDHVMDGLATRFDGVTVLETVAHGGWTFVIAAGADAGLSLLALLPEGRLVHLATLADRGDLTLEGITALRAAMVGDALQIMVLSGAEAGLTQLSVSLAGLGVVAGSGGLGRDVVLDGAGSEVLQGGAGADLFVLRADGRRDVIADFDPAQDRIDLTGWAFFRNSGQLTMTPTATGALLRFWGEELEIRTATGRGLSLAELRGMVFGEMDRLSLAPPSEPPEEEPPEEEPPEEEPPVNPGDGLEGSAGADTLRGGSGPDRIFGGAGHDSLLGGEGADTLDGGVGEDVLNGEAGEDSLVGGVGNDGLFGGDGGDRLFGGDGGDTLDGGAGEDVLNGEAGEDLLSGGAGNDTLLGGTGHDTLQGHDGLDRLQGGEGDDRLIGGAERDTLWGGWGMDHLIGESGNDAMLGGRQNDTLEGGDGNDRLSGGGQADALYGGAGADRLLGGAGWDRLWGGAGADVFVFLPADAGGWDRIFDFQPDEDRLAFRGLSGMGEVRVRDVLQDGVRVAEVTGGGHVIRLEGVRAADLDAGDFLFL